MYNIYIYHRKAFFFRAGRQKTSILNQKRCAKLAYNLTVNYVMYVASIGAP